jgi:RNA polymerase sigma factor (sigma-70 family)
MANSKIKSHEGPSMIDVLKFKLVIKDVLSKTKTPPSKAEDMTQECYLALIEKQDLIEAARNPEGYAAQVCRNRVYEVWRKETDSRSDDPTNLRFSSLSDLGVYHKVLKIACPEKQVTDEELYRAISKLPLDEYRAIYGIFVEGKTRQALAEELGFGITKLGNQVKRGIDKLKKHFEV